LAYVFSYLYLWTVSPEVWPWSGNGPQPPPVIWPGTSAVLLAIGVGLFVLADKRLLAPGRFAVISPFATLLGSLVLIAAVGLEIWSHWQTGLTPTQSAYGAMVYMA